MTTIAAAVPSTRRANSEFWFTLLAVAALALALTVYVTRVVTQSSGAVAPGHQANVPTSQYNQLCAPAPGTRFC